MIILFRQEVNKLLIFAAAGVQRLRELGPLLSSGPLTGDAGEQESMPILARRKGSGIASCFLDDYEGMRSCTAWLLRKEALI